MDPLADLNLVVTIFLRFVTPEVCRQSTLHLISTACVEAGIDMDLYLGLAQGRECLPWPPRQADNANTYGTFLELTFSVMQNCKLREAVHILPGARYEDKGQSSQSSAGITSVFRRMGPGQVVVLQAATQVLRFPDAFLCLQQPLW